MKPRTVTSPKHPKTCSVVGCEAVHYCKSFCAKHYQRMRAHGDPLREPRRAPQVPCQVAGCENLGVTLNNTLCLTHYARHKAGTDLTRPLRVSRQQRGICTVSGCGAADCGPQGYCLKHLTRIKRHGNPHTVIHQKDRGGKLEHHPRWTGANATYTAVHQRLRARRGSASAHPCVDCGRRAAQWSFSHQCPETRDSEFGPYSPNIDAYFPRCVSCHKKFDLSREKRK